MPSTRVTTMSRIDSGVHTVPSANSTRPTYRHESRYAPRSVSESDPPTRNTRSSPERDNDTIDGATPCEKRITSSRQHES